MRYLKAGFWILAFLCGWCIPILAQAVPVTHTATMTWTAPADAIPSSTYNVYFVNAVCPVTGLGTLTWAKINSTPIVGLTYTQGGLIAGNYCWYVTQVQNGVESAPSTTAGGTAKPGTVTFSVTIS